MEADIASVILSDEKALERSLHQRAREIWNLEAGSEPDSLEPAACEIEPRREP